MTTWDENALFWLASGALLALQPLALAQIVIPCGGGGFQTVMCWPLPPCSLTSGPIFFFYYMSSDFEQKNPTKFLFMMPVLFSILSEHSLKVLCPISTSFTYSVVNLAV